MKRILLCGLIVFTFLSTQACPVYYHGKVFIVNEQMESIKDVEFWEMRNVEDSFKRTQSRWIHESEKDSVSWRFFSGGWRWGLVLSEEEEKQSSSYRFRIKAKGYADVVISNINFKHRMWLDSTSVDPVLYIVMRTHQYETVGNTIKRIEAYHVKKDIEVKDTLIYKMPETFSTEKEVIGESPILSFPNPVVDKLNVIFTVAPSLGNTYMIRNYLGQELKKGTLEEAKNELVLQSLKAGNYTLEIKDENGNIRYINKFVKVPN